MNQKRPSFLTYVLIFLLSFLTVQLLFGKEEGDPILDQGVVGLKAVKDEYAVGKNILIEFQNNSDDVITIDTCGEGSMVSVEKFANTTFEPVQGDLEVDCSQVPDLVLEPGETGRLSFIHQSYDLFGELGRYRVALQLGENEETETFYTPEFEIEEPGIFTKFWRHVLYIPILNALIAILIYTPGHSLAIAVIVLTLIIRTILLIPTQKGLKAQKRLQNLQPKLEELKEKYAHDKTRLAQEQMLLWKENKVNPLSSCLPILIQAPILIALFYTIQGGLEPDRAVLVYSFLPDFSLSDIDPYLFGFDLTTRSLIVFPIIVGLLQFIQMQLSMGMRNKKKTSSLPSEFQKANRMMVYVMPLLIGFFTTQVPAAVGLYWGVSTFYGIIQQIVVNKMGTDISPDKSEDIQVRVIEKKN